MSYEEVHRATPAVYQKHAEAWDKQRSRSLFERSWLDKLIQHLPEGARILDVGCGAGQPISQYLLTRGFSLSGIDASEKMIQICRSRFPEHSWEVMDMRNLELEEQFDAIVAWDSFFHLKQGEQREVLQRFLQHLAPSAAMLLTVGHEAGEVLGKVNGEQVYHSSLDPEEYKAILREAGFADIEMVLQDKECAEHSVLLARR